MHLCTLNFFFSSFALYYFPVLAKTHRNASFMSCTKQKRPFSNGGCDIVYGSVKHEFFLKVLESGHTGCTVLDIGSIRALFETMRDISEANPVDMEALRDVFEDYRTELAVRLNALHGLATLLGPAPPNSP